MRHLGINNFSQLPMKNTTMETLGEYPLKPNVGRFALIARCVQVCIELEDKTPFWVPLTGELALHEHQQAIASTEWLVVHGMNTMTPIIQCYDDSGAVVIPSSIQSVDADTIKITWYIAKSGRAIAMTGATVGAPRVDIGYQEDFTEMLDQEFTHNLGYYPTVQIISEGKLVQPKSVEHPTVNKTRIVLHNTLSGEIQLR